MVQLQTLIQAKKFEEFEKFEGYIVAKYVSYARIDRMVQL